MCAGEKEYLTVKVYGQKEKFQKHLVLLNIREVFLELKKVKPDVQIGFSKFCDLWPKYIMNINLSSMQSLCLWVSSKCEVKIDYKDVNCKAVCNIDTRNCMLENMFVKTALENKASKITW